MAEIQQLKSWIKQLILAEFQASSQAGIPAQILAQLRSQGYLDPSGKLAPSARSQIRIGLVGGVFDLIHPGHIFFLERAKSYCDLLIAIVARDSMITHKPKPILPEQLRLRLVAALKPVDLAVLGSQRDMFEPVIRFDPDLIILGPDQHFSEEWLQHELAKRGLRAQVIRIHEREPHPLAKTSQLLKRILNSSRASDELKHEDC